MLRNDSNRVIQPEVIYRSDTLGQTSSNTIAGSSNNAIDRKGSVAIGQSVFYTDYPPQDYGSSGKYHFMHNIFNWILFPFSSVFVCCIRRALFIKSVGIYQTISKPKSMRFKAEINAMFISNLPLFYWIFFPFRHISASMRTNRMHKFHSDTLPGQVLIVVIKPYPKVKSTNNSTC